jgi:hypothetical protein
MEDSGKTESHPTMPNASIAQSIDAALTAATGISGFAAIALEVQQQLLAMALIAEDLDPIEPGDVHLGYTNGRPNQGPQ